MEIIVRGSSLKDKSGERIWWPKGEKQYFDQAARRVFRSPEEKKQWMDKNNVVSDGTSDREFNKQAMKILEEEKYKEKIKEEKNKNRKEKR